jgi:hypothetical protein
MNARWHGRWKWATYTRKEAGKMKLLPLLCTLVLCVDEGGTAQDEMFQGVARNSGVRLIDFGPILLRIMVGNQRPNRWARCSRTRRVLVS